MQKRKAARIGGKNPALPGKKSRSRNMAGNAPARSKRWKNLGKRIPAAAFRKSIVTEAANARDWLGASQIAEDERKRRIIWSWAVSLAIVLSFYMFFTEIGSWFGWWGATTSRQAEMFEKANLAIIVVLGIDIYNRFKVATDRAAFLRQNALELVALIPIGTIFRMGQALESFSLLKNFAFLEGAEGMLRAAPVAGAFREASFAGGMARLGEAWVQLASAAGKYVVQAHSALNNLSTFTEFLGRTAEAASKVLRLR